MKLLFFSSHGAKCFSADLIVYDIVCDRWHNVQDSVPKDLNADMARFGHSAVLRNGTMLIHGGFQVHFDFPYVFQNEDLRGLEHRKVLLACS